MCKDPQKTFLLSLAMYSIMAQSMTKTIQDVLDSKDFCDAHKSLNITFLLEICIPIVEAITTYTGECGDLGIPATDPIMQQGLDSILDMTIVGIKAKTLAMSELQGKEGSQDFQDKFKDYLPEEDTPRLEALKESLQDLRQREAESTEPLGGRFDA